MFEQLKISNFRSHKNTVLDFAPGVNCVVGLPDSGKTNIIRAINWALTNRPLGQRIKSDFTDADTTVSLSFTNKDIISLTKNKKSSEYSCNNQVMKAMGGEIPDVISKAANVTELTLQKQLDKPFLITATPGEVAKVFNRITKLEKVDAVAALITTDINSENKKIRQLELQEAELIKQIDKIGDVKAMEVDQQAIQALANSILEVQDSYDAVIEIVHEINDCDLKLKKLGKVNEDADKELIELDKIIKAIGNIEDEYDEVEEVLASYDDSNSKMLFYKETLSKKIVEFKEFLKTVTVCPFCDHCKEDIHKHNLDEFLGAYEV